MEKTRRYELNIDYEEIYKTILEANDQISPFSDGLNKIGFLYDRSMAYNKIVNIYSVFSGYPCWYQLWNEVVRAIHEYLIEFDVNCDNGLWMRSWVLMHEGTLEPESHIHAWPFSGYVTIAPEDSATVFTQGLEGVERHRIYPNIPGITHIFPKGDEYAHHVEYITSPLARTRVSLGFDVLNEPCALGDFTFIPIPMPPGYIRKC